MRNKKKKNYAGIFISVFIVLILISSILGYIFGDQQNTTVRYNNQKFVLTNNGWRTNINGDVLYFSMVPNDLEDIEFPEIPNLQNVLEIDTTYDFDSEYKEDIAKSIFELSQVLSKKGIYVLQGFTTNTSFDLPIITCEDSTQFVPIVYYKSSNQTKIYLNNNCIIIEGNNQNSFIPLTDRLAYQILGIMN
jgi:hypothetical protein